MYDTVLLLCIALGIVAGSLLSGAQNIYTIGVLFIVVISSLIFNYIFLVQPFVASNVIIFISFSISITAYILRVYKYDDSLQGVGIRILLSIPCIFIDMMNMIWGALVRLVDSSSSETPEAPTVIYFIMSMSFLFGLYYTNTYKRMISSVAGDSTYTVISSNDESTVRKINLPGVTIDTTDIRQNSFLTKYPDQTYIHSVLDLSKKYTYFLLEDRVHFVKFKSHINSFTKTKYVENVNNGVVDGVVKSGAVNSMNIWSIQTSIGTELVSFKLTHEGKFIITGLYVKDSATDPKIVDTVIYDSFHDYTIKMNTDRIIVERNNEPLCTLDYYPLTEKQYQIVIGDDTKYNGKNYTQLQGYITEFIISS